LSGETRGVKSLICPTAQAKNFSQGDWTGFFDLPVGQKIQAAGAIEQPVRRDIFEFDLRQNESPRFQ
jgi:hypothetical protein